MADDIGSRDPAARAAAREALARAGVEVLHEDNHVLVIAKPAGLLSQAGPKDALALPEVIAEYRRAAEGKEGRAYVGLVHRLDRNVSGVMVLAKTSKAASRISREFRERSATLRKTYLAWVAGRPAEAQGELVGRLRREGRVTHAADEDEESVREGRLAYVLEGTGTRASRLRVDLHTGLPHQIRAQLAAAGHPLLGDGKYGGPDGGIGARPALHALRLTFRHPVKDALIDLVATVPSDLIRLDHTLRIAPPVAPWLGGRR